jgi:Flp pilus assembly protein TadB
VGQQKQQETKRMSRRADDGQGVREPTTVSPDRCVSPLRTLWRYVRRTLVVVLGVVLVILGVIMLVTPGPAIVVIPVGLAMLGVRFDWLRLRAARLRDQLRRWARRTKPPRNAGRLPSHNRTTFAEGSTPRERVSSNVS